MGDYNFSESRYFDHLVERHGDVWWGNATGAGIERQRRRAKLLFRLLTRYNSPVILELGCGSGVFSKYILKESQSVRFIGCDISQKAVGLAKKRNLNYPNASFLITDVVSLPYKEGIFDAVVGNSILHHLPLVAVLKECYRVLKPGGRIWFSEPNMLNPQIFIEKNFYFIGKILQNTKYETAFFRWPLVRKMQNVGFCNVIVKPFDFLHPLIPSRLINIVNRIGLSLERIAILKEFAGSLFITANK